MASPRTQFYHAAAAIDGTLKGVERCIRRAEGVGLVVGPPGTGKSLLLLKLAEHVRDDFDVAQLAGESICTRRALWQSILAAIGEPYRGIDEADLRIAIVERIRGLAAAGSGLVILVDEAHTLPTRLIEELRLLTNVPTPLPAVHIVLAGTARLEEMLGAPRMESLAQRIAVRGYLEPLDHAETLAYLRTQVAAAGLVWGRLFAEGCEDAIYRVTDGVPRLINQVCDQALVLVAESDRRVTTADIAAAWRETQRLPAPAGLEPGPADVARSREGRPSTIAPHDLGGEGGGVIEFGADDGIVEVGVPVDPAAGFVTRAGADPFEGPAVELSHGCEDDPFEEFFERRRERVSDPCGLEGPDDFSGCRQVASREGQSLGKLLATVGRDALDPSQPARRGAGDAAGQPGVSRPPAGAADASRRHARAGGSGAVAQGRPDELVEIDDSDMVVIEEDLREAGAAGPQGVFAVRPGDYRSLFTRLRRSR